MRREFPAKVRTAAWQRCEGKCESCTRPLHPGDIRFDHDNPDGLTGEPVLENCKVLCRSCHQVKTVERDIPAIARAKRRERAHLGIKPSSSRPMPGSKASGLKKRMDGTVEKRTDD